jgi:hypothetical protein
MKCAKIHAITNLIRQKKPRRNLARLFSIKQQKQCFFTKKRFKSLFNSRENCTFAMI